MMNSAEPGAELGNTEATFESTGEKVNPENEAAATGDADLTGEESFSELINGKYKNEFSEKVQAIIDRRFKKMKELETFSDEVSPVIEALCEKLGTKKGDIAALKEAFFAASLKKEAGNEAYVADDADPTGEENGAQRDAEDALKALFSEGEALKELYPEFDLRRELRTPLFSKLLKCGLTVKDAFEATHKDELISGAMAYTARAVREQLAGNLEIKSRRPLENGLLSSSAAVTKTNVNSLTSDDILKIIKQVEKGAKIEF